MLALLTAAWLALTGMAAQAGIEVFISTYDAAAIKQPFVKGGLVRTMWETLERAPGEYDWSDVDRKIDPYVSAGKQFSLAVIAGPHTPKFYQTGTVVNFSNKRGPASMPVPWDETYRRGLEMLFDALGKRYASHPNLRLVYVPQSSLNGIEGSLPSRVSPAWDTLGYSPRRHADAVVELAKKIKVAFPNVPVVVELHETLRSAEQARLVMQGLDPKQFGIAAWWIGQGAYQRDLQRAMAAWPGPKFMQAIGAAFREPDPRRGYRLRDYDDRPWGIDGLRRHTLDVGGNYLELWPRDAVIHAREVANW